MSTPLTAIPSPKTILNCLSSQHGMVSTLITQKGRQMRERKAKKLTPAEHRKKKQSE